MILKIGEGILPSFEVWGRKMDFREN